MKKRMNALVWERTVLFFLPIYPADSKIFWLGHITQFMKESKMIKQMTFLLIALALFSAGCVSAQFHPAAGVPNYPASDKVLVLKSIPDRPYVTLGEITARGQDERRIVDSIRKKAMKAGAEAIILTPSESRTSGIKEQRQGQFAKEEILMRAIVIRFRQ